MTTALEDLKAGWTLPANTVSFTFAPHAVEQVNRRHLRLLDLDEATRQLYRLAAENGKVTLSQPKWLRKAGPS